MLDGKVIYMDLYNFSNGPTVNPPSYMSEVRKLVIRSWFSFRAKCRIEHRLLHTTMKTYFI